MKCTVCGYEAAQNFDFCPFCGKPAQEQEVVGDNKILSALKDNLFLVICIAMSVATLFGLANGGLPALNILYTVFLWLTYSQVRNNVADKTYLRNISGTVFASKVIDYVVFGLFLLLGVLLTVAFSALSGMPGIFDAITEYAVDMDPQTMWLLQQLFGIGSWLILLIFGGIGIGGILITLFGVRKIHHLAKSVYEQADAPAPVLHTANGAKIWLFILGGCAALGALGSLLDGATTAFLADGAQAAAAILSGVLIKKHLQ